MKQKGKKPLSRKKKLLVVITTLILGGGLFGIIYFVSLKKPTWTSTASFEDNRLLVSVEKTYTEHKSAREDFFLIHTYDFQTKTFEDQIKIPIPEAEAYRSEYVGYSVRYIWFKAPYFIALDMRTRKILDFSTIKKRICAKNPGQFKDIIEMARVQNYITATNQEGDEFYVNVETFATSKTPPEPFYDVFHKTFTVLDHLPEFINPNNGYPDVESAVTVGKMDYLLKPIDRSNRMKLSFFSTPNTGPAKISITVTDSTQAAIQNGNMVTPVPQTEDIPTEEKRLTNRSFINAEGLGVCNNRFVFCYQKTVGETAARYLAWFDLKTNSVVKEINLETKGIKVETPFEYVKQWVSVDGKWAYFAIENKAPVRIKL